MAPSIALRKLRHYWGYSSFRYPQQDVIEVVLRGEDVLLVMCTGGGKSITYQVPALVSGGISVVISPLIALMEDQVAGLTARGIPAAFLGSAQASDAVRTAAWRGEYTMLYMTPELAMNSGARLKALHKAKRITLVAIDEAHCVSEWGSDFRVEYQQLGGLRDVLPGVPFMALTATATHIVQEEVLTNLRMNKNCHRFIMPFERDNLHISVEKREGSMQHSLRTLLERKQAAAQARRSFEPTLIYCLTRTQVEDIASFLSAADKFGNKVAKYHGQMSVGARRESHNSFLRDDAEVMVATLAYGMGIDKANIRHIIHWGTPASLEAYYQQAGRGGRDGAPATCLLLHSGKDVSLLDVIKNASTLSVVGRQAYERGLNLMQAFCRAATCRHALIAAHFASPGQQATSMNTKPCRGGCDICDARKSNSLKSQDVGPQAAALLQVVKALNGAFGQVCARMMQQAPPSGTASPAHFQQLQGKSIAILRGSNAKSMADHHKQLKDKQGDLLFGSGKAHSEEWWKGLQGLLVGQGLLTLQTRGVAGAFKSFSALCITSQGLSWLSIPSPMVVDLPPAMLQEQTAAAQQLERQKQAAAAAAAMRVAADEAASETAKEQAALLEQLRVMRKQTADSLGMPPDSLVNEGTLRQIASLRPASLDELDSINGMSAAAMKHFGQPLLQTVTQVVAASKHLKHAADTWNTIHRSSSSAANNKQPQAAVISEGRPVDDNLADMLMTLIQDKGPGPAVFAAAEKYMGGANISHIVSSSPKPIQPGTILSYLAQAAVNGCDINLERLMSESKLSHSAALSIADIMRQLAEMGADRLMLRAIKDACDPAIEYGHIKLVAAMMITRQVLFYKPGEVLEHDNAPADRPHVQGTNNSTYGGTHTAAAAAADTSVMMVDAPLTKHSGTLNNALAAAHVTTSQQHAVGTQPPAAEPVVTDSGAAAACGRDASHNAAEQEQGWTQLNRTRIKTEVEKPSTSPPDCAAVIQPVTTQPGTCVGQSATAEEIMNALQPSTALPAAKKRAKPFSLFNTGRPKSCRRLG